MIQIFFKVYISFLNMDEWWGAFKNLISREKAHDCKQLIKYDGRNFKFSGLTLGDFQMGGINISKEKLQIACHTAMLLDQSQYNLCLEIKRIQNKKERDKYTKQIIEDRIKSNRIMTTIAALSINPDNKYSQETLEKLISQNGTRALEIETNNPIEKTQNEEIDNGTILEENTLREKIDGAKIEVINFAHTKVDHNPEANNNSEINEKWIILSAVIEKLDEMYNDIQFRESTLEKFWESLEPTVRFLRKRENEQTIGPHNRRSLNRLTNNASEELKQYNIAIENDEKNEQKKHKRATMDAFDGIIALLIKINEYIRN